MRPSLYYNRQGEPIGLHEWADLMEDAEYRLVANTEVGPYRISTVWLGLDHSWSSIVGGPGVPIIFETMVFGGGGEIQQRYDTEAQARRGHDAIVAEVTDWT